MGLDMSAYRYAELVEAGEYDEDTAHARYGGRQNFVWLHNTPEFAATEAGLKQGWYKTPRYGSDDYFGWRAGSYSGYSYFRNLLAGMFDRTAEDYWDNGDPEWPFYELINYSDCEGAMGPEAIKNVLSDFIEHENLFKKTYPEDSSWYLEVYGNWIKGLTLAQDGIVLFH